MLTFFTGQIKTDLLFEVREIESDVRRAENVQYGCWSTHYSSHLITAARSYGTEPLADEISYGGSIERHDNWTCLNGAHAAKRQGANTTSLSIVRLLVAIMRTRCLERILWNGLLSAEIYTRSYMVTHS